MRACCPLIWECLLLVLYIFFLPLYLNFRSQASILDDAYPLYSNWLWDICLILVVIMIFFTGLILFLLWTLKRYEQMSCLSFMSRNLPTPDSDQNNSQSAEFQENYDVNCNMFLETGEDAMLSQNQENYELESFNPLQPLRLDCSRN